ncbi:MAG: DUF3667 domain-containing protein [Bacteroidetes bacterium]|nr:DUF3667 domain-containing protein [Bacteroidota bacterium]MBS1930968.1 DUF3667 domain-containing protein [Bacteroidota bacterium]
MEIPDPIYIEKKCPACGKMSPGIYCMYCGEKLQHERVTLLRFAKTLPEIIFHVGFNIFYTIYELLRHPGQMVKGYFAGNRKKHYKPINFFLFIGGIVAVLFISNHISPPDSKMYEEWMDDKKLGHQLDLINQEYLTGILMLQFPIVALCTWLFFRQRKHYFGEHLVANAYFIGEASLIRIIFFPVYYFNNKTNVVDTLDTIYVVLTICYYIYAFYDWLYNKKTWKGFFITTIFVVLVYILVMFLTVLLLIPMLYLFKQTMAAIF